MKSLYLISSSPSLSLSRTNLKLSPLSLYLSHAKRRDGFVSLCFSNPQKPSSTKTTITSSNEESMDLTKTSKASFTVLEDKSINEYKSQMGISISPRLSNPLLAKLSLVDHASLLLSFIACTTSLAFTSFVIAAIPTLVAMGRVASSFAKLADTARKELPSTLAAMRLSGMEISDLTLELSDLSQDINDGINKSAKAVQAAEAGIRKIGTLAHQQTISMIEERANLPEISLKPVVAGAAKKTSQAIGRATKTLMNIITRGDKDDV
ncbi:unnamed protein product [Cochlearia groenlandica]